MNFNILRRQSTIHAEPDEEEVKRLAMQRRRSSIAITQQDDEPILPTAINPIIEIFPNSTSRRQQTLLISPDPSSRGYIIICARTNKPFLTVVSSQNSLPGPSHTKHFYGSLNKPWQFGNGRKDSDESNSGKDEADSLKKLCTLERDSLSFRKRHYVQDPYTNHQLLAMEFTTSTWDAGALKANIELLNRYSTGFPMEPVHLKWKGKKASLEGVLEVNKNPAAVCAKGSETSAGEYALYVAPGMDMYICAIVVMAVDDRIRRGSGDGSHSNGAFSPENLNRMGSFGFPPKEDAVAS